MSDFRGQMKNYSGEGALYDGNKKYVLADPAKIKTSELSDIKEGDALKKLVSFAGTRKVLNKIDTENPNDLNLYNPANYEIIKSLVWQRNVFHWSTGLAVAVCVACLAIIIWQIAANDSNPLALFLACGVLFATIVIEVTYHGYHKNKIISDYENIRDNIST